MQPRRRALIFDEVMTGFRVARGGAQELYGITPDLTAFGKVIGGGLPVGAFGGRAEIMDHLSPDGAVYQAGTLSGNPLAMAAGLAQLRELERIDGWSLLEQLGAQLEESMRAVIRQSKIPLTFHRIGSMFCLFFTAGPVTNLATAKGSDRDAFARYFRTVSTTASTSRRRNSRPGFSRLRTPPPISREPPRSLPKLCARAQLLSCSTSLRTSPQILVACLYMFCLVLVWLLSQTLLGPSNTTLNSSAAPRSAITAA
jgi:glutamate-1-semialdehyde 2,1-aminomutase